MTALQSRVYGFRRAEIQSLGGFIGSGWNQGFKSADFGTIVLISTPFSRKQAHVSLRNPERTLCNTPSSARIEDCIGKHLEAATRASLYIHVFRISSLANGARSHLLKLPFGLPSNNQNSPFQKHWDMEALSRSPRKIPHLRISSGGSLYQNLR